MENSLPQPILVGRNYHSIKNTQGTSLPTLFWAFLMPINSCRSNIIYLLHCIFSVLLLKKMVIFPIKFMKFLFQLKVPKAFATVLWWSSDVLNVKNSSSSPWSIYTYNIREGILYLHNHKTDPDNYKRGTCMVLGAEAKEAGKVGRTKLRFV